MSFSLFNDRDLSFGHVLAFSSIFGVVFILGTVCCFLVGLIFPIVGAVLLKSVQNGRNTNIQSYTNVVDAWSLKYYQINKEIIMETITSNRNDSFFLTNINDDINDTPAPFYFPLQYKNMAFNFISGETFNNSISMFSTLVYYKTKSNPTRIKFKNPIIDDKFTTNDISTSSLECQTLGGFAFAIGKCRLFYKMKSLCAVLHFDTLEHETCPGEKRYAQYSIIPYSQINNPQSSVGEFMFREAHDPFIYLYKISNGKLTYGTNGSPVAGILLIVIGSLILFFVCVVVSIVVVVILLAFGLFTDTLSLCCSIFNAILK
jgi:hypothetical protein